VYILSRSAILRKKRQNNNTCLGFKRLILVSLSTFKSFLRFTAYALLTLD
jgi:hypothetical protein